MIPKSSNRTRQTSDQYSNFAESEKRKSPGNSRRDSFRSRAHPSEMPRSGSANRSGGNFIYRIFLEIASWFAKKTSARPVKEAVERLNEAAAIGNTKAIEILLDRCEDLGKDVQMILPALQTAVANGKPAATSVLLKKVLEIKPDYVKDCALTTRSAHKRQANVLEVLVEHGMALPSPEGQWERYGEAIGDYLRWSAERSTKGSAKRSEVLSFVMETIWNKPDLELDAEFGGYLNETHGSLNPEQKACVREALVEVEPQTYIAAGFTATTAESLAEGLNANARRHIARNGNNASAALAKAVADEFANVAVTGTSRPGLRRYLMEKGMYGMLADLVDTAVASAAADPSWNEPGISRELVLANALDKSALEGMHRIHWAGDASGAPALFDKLLSPQLDLLISYWESVLAKGKIAESSRRSTPAASPP